MKGNSSNNSSNNSKGDRKMRPKPIPLLNEEQFAEITKEIKRTPSKEDIRRFKRAKEILKRHSV